MLEMHSHAIDSFMPLSISFCRLGLPSKKFEKELVATPMAIQQRTPIS